MNAKFRPFYLIAGAIGLGLLIFYVLSNPSDIDPATVLIIALPDMFFFYLAYKTYPEDSVADRLERY
jgi:hypothetical protein